VGLSAYMAISVLGYYMRDGGDFLRLAFLVGMVQGGTQALSRSLFASMIPRHKSGEFFGFWSVFEKFAGIFGPLIFTLTLAATGSSRNAILSVIGFFIVGGACWRSWTWRRGGGRARGGSALREFRRLSLSRCPHLPLRAARFARRIDRRIEGVGLGKPALEARAQRGRVPAGRSQDPAIALRIFGSRLVRRSAQREGGRVTCRGVSAGQRTAPRQDAFDSSLPIPLGPPNAVSACQSGGRPPEVSSPGTASRRGSRCRG
jgi:hypothetical protein